MSKWLVAFIGVVYLIVSLDQARKGDWSSCLTWACYSLANFGLMFKVS